MLLVKNTNFVRQKASDYFYVNSVVFQVQLKVPVTSPIFDRKQLHEEIITSIINEYGYDITEYIIARQQVTDPTTTQHPFDVFSHIVFISRSENDYIDNVSHVLNFRRDTITRDWLQWKEAIKIRSGYDLTSLGWYDPIPPFNTHDPVVYYVVDQYFREPERGHKLRSVVLNGMTNFTKTVLSLVKEDSNEQYCYFRLMIPSIYSQLMTRFNNALLQVIELDEIFGEGGLQLKQKTRRYNNNGTRPIIL